MNALGRTAFLTMVLLLFLVTHSYAYIISYDGVEATQGALNAGLTSGRAGINPVGNTANSTLGYFIETFDRLDGSGGFNTLNATKLIVDGGGYGIKKDSNNIAAAPAGDFTNYFYAPGTGQAASVKVPNTAYFAFMPGLRIDYLGLYFGSIDTYNSIEFFTKESDVTPYFIITGQNILDASVGSVSGNQFQAGSNVYVNIDFNSTEVFSAFAVKTTGVALELDNVVARVSPVPEPSTFILFGAGLLGLVALGRKRFAQ